MSEAAKQAHVLGVWSLVVSLVGLFLCVGILSPVAIILGVKANRAGTNSLGTLGLVLGIIGTAILVLWVVVMLVLNLSAGGSHTAATHSPDVLLPHLRLWTLYLRGWAAP